MSGAEEGREGGRGAGEERRRRRAEKKRVKIVDIGYCRWQIGCCAARSTAAGLFPQLSLVRPAISERFRVLMKFPLIDRRGVGVAVYFSCSLAHRRPTIRSRVSFPNRRVDGQTVQRR